MQGCGRSGRSAGRVQRQNRRPWSPPCALAPSPPSFVDADARMIAGRPAGYGSLECALHPSGYHNSDEIDFDEIKGALSRNHKCKHSPRRSHNHKQSQRQTQTHTIIGFPMRRSQLDSLCILIVVVTVECLPQASLSASSPMACGTVRSMDKPAWLAEQRARTSHRGVPECPAGDGGLLQETAPSSTRLAQRARASRTPTTV